MTADDVRALLQGRIDDAGSTKAWALANRVSPTYVGDVLRGFKEPSFAILTPLGLRRVVTYEIASDAPAGESSNLTPPDPTSAGEVGGDGSLPVAAHGAL